MKIQPIQNNSNNQNFKAKFINDVNGNFRRLWDVAPATDTFAKQVEKFTNTNKHHVLEITEIKPDLEMDNYGKWQSGTRFSIYNHTNGKISEYFQAAIFAENRSGALLTWKGSLLFILESLMKEKSFFSEDDKKSKLYKQLTTTKNE